MSDRKEELQTAVFEIVAELVSAEPGEIKGEDRLREDLGLDSLQSMELLSRVSETFEIDPDLEEVMDLATVEEVITSLAAHLEGA
ncbi:MAG: acyl carrier protein [Deltaproteobacteria bacterium]|nr:acyl carrier protein [Deltaproteobacteria bacterium]